MLEMKKKIKRIAPIIKVRKANLDKEATALREIRDLKTKVQVELKRCEKKYISMIDDLNQERLSSLRDRLDILERGVDYSKQLWQQTLIELRGVESRERSQLNQVLMARQELKAVEKLQDRYQAQAEFAERSNEQKRLDEAGLIDFTASQNRR